ncbi:SgcJ/EcaC family oxidoreductase [Nonomuraea sp. NEAU-A123]|uniref:YybH family protein n=1 Tax=Nonomuraea sp. NEAU-A123 TaxID=2839649 RepID=UPI001BE44FCA|nr:SgcJ/EcaC family oxidoreductase [Nonomuraea sp. NEAU-A123]MBT2229246.1 SgcJ/EcaC family oxidoreductase [Nonomuraea sp. NEAU-A123]
MEFSQALAAHLRAIETRDLDGFLATVHPDASVILPNGKLLTGKDAIGEFHTAWFRDPDWSLRPTVIRTETFGESAFVVLSVAYADLDSEGRPYEKSYYLTLYFARIDGRWLLVHDQNTFS